MFGVLLVAIGIGVANACCPPPQWQTNAFDMNSLDSHPYHMTLGHDDETRMEGVYVYVIGLPGIYKHYVKDFNTMTQYEMDGGNPSTCTQKPLEETFFAHDACENGDLTGIRNFEHYGHVSIGLPPSTIQMESMSFEVDEKRVYLGLGQNGCFPIYEKVKSSNGDSHPDMMLFYFNTTATLTDRALVTIPEGCHNAV